MQQFKFTIAKYNTSESNPFNNKKQPYYKSKIPIYDAKITIENSTEDYVPNDFKATFMFNTSDSFPQLSDNDTF